MEHGNDFLAERGSIMKKKWINKIKAALSETKGETIAETLVAVLIVSLAMTMLAGAIMASANMNDATKKQQTQFRADNVTTSDSEVLIHHSDGTPDEKVSVWFYTTNDENKYVYYEKK